MNAIRKLAPQAVYMLVVVLISVLISLYLRSLLFWTDVIIAWLVSCVVISALGKFVTINPNDQLGADGILDIFVALFVALCVVAVAHLIVLTTVDSNGITDSQQFGFLDTLKNTWVESLVTSFCSGLFVALSGVGNPSAN